MTMRAIPNSRPVVFGGRQFAAIAAMELVLFCGLLSKKLDSCSVPTLYHASNVPAHVLIGSRVRRNTDGTPAACELQTSAFCMPGPHQTFSVDTPSSMRGRRSVMEDWPRSIERNGWSPKREGRSMPFGAG